MPIDCEVAYLSYRLTLSISIFYYIWTDLDLWPRILALGGEHSRVHTYNGGHFDLSVCRAGISSWYLAINRCSYYSGFWGLDFLLPLMNIEALWGFVEF